MTGDKSLYDRLGEKPAITAVVEDFVARVAADSRINGKFANANIPRLKSMLVDQICQASGGPCTLGALGPMRATSSRSRWPRCGSHFPLDAMCAPGGPS